jgi:DNA polymerase-3 subunit epsilon
MDFDEAEQVLKESSGHRVLRRVPPVAEWRLPPATGPTRSALFVDIKTTGPNIETDQVMAIGMIAFDYDLRSGALVSVGEAMAFDDPGPTELEEIEGLGRETQLVIAHDAAFVRPMAEKLSPVFAEMNWAGSLNEIDWASEGLASVRLDDLLPRMGWFNESVDVASQARGGAFLMSLALPRSGTSVLRALLAHARRDIMLVRAENIPFGTRETLRERGYHWDGRQRCWSILTETPEVEIAWLNAVIYEEPREIIPIRMPATRRYSRRHGDE